MSAAIAANAADRAKAEAAVVRALANLAQRKAANRRQVKLTRQDIASIQRAEEARLDEDVARAEVAVAEAELAVIRAQGQDATAALQLEQTLFDPHRLTAPFDACTQGRFAEALNIPTDTREAVARMKWDFNEDLLRGGWADGTPANLARLDPLVAHIRGVYLLQDELHAALPDLIIEMCASGGGRFDGEILRRAHVQWMSDQWEPLKNLSIHFGSQLCHPAEQCNDWLIQWPAGTDLRGDLLFRLRVAMLGSFGLSAKIGDWPQADLDTATAEIDWYKSTARALIRDGDQYILTKAPTLDGHGDWAAMWFAAKDQSGGMALIFRLQAAEPSHSFALHGLDPSARYRLSIPGHPGQELTGAALANGVSVTVPELYQSTKLTVTRVAS